LKEARPESAAPPTNDGYPTAPARKPVVDARFPGQRPPRVPRADIGETTRLWLGLGEEHGLVPGGVVGCILGETGLPSSAVGKVDIRERHTFVEVSAEHAAAILSKLKRAQITGRPVKAKLA